MKHFLFVTWEGGGTIPPELGLARKLIARGHRVTVLGDDCTRDEVQDAGATFVGYQHAPNRQSKGKEHDPVQDWTFANPLSALKSAVVNRMCGPALETARDIIELHA